MHPSKGRIHLRVALLTLRFWPLVDISRDRPPPPGPKDNSRQPPPPPWDSNRPPPPPRDRRAPSPPRRTNGDSHPPTNDHDVDMASESNNGTAKTQPEAEEDEEEGIDPALAAMMGFAGFGSTQGSRVKGNDEGTAAVKVERKYRQYMNRPGGFNRYVHRNLDLDSSSVTMTYRALDKMV